MTDPSGFSGSSALRTLRAKKPAKLIAAFAVAPAVTLARIQAEADEVACLYAPDEFYAVGEFFVGFAQVSDEQVIEILKREVPKKAAG